MITAKQIEAALVRCATAINTPPPPAALDSGGDTSSSDRKHRAGNKSSKSTLAAPKSKSLAVKSATGSGGGGGGGGGWELRSIAAPPPPQSLPVTLKSRTAPLTRIWFDPGCALSAMRADCDIVATTRMSDDLSVVVVMVWRIDQSSSSLVGVGVTERRADPPESGWDTGTCAVPVCPIGLYEVRIGGGSGGKEARTIWMFCAMSEGPRHLTFTMCHAWKMPWKIPAPDTGTTAPPMLERTLSVINAFRFQTGSSRQFHPQIFPSGRVFMGIGSTLISPGTGTGSGTGSSPAAVNITSALSSSSPLDDTDNDWVYVPLPNTIDSRYDAVGFSRTGIEFSAVGGEAIGGGRNDESGGNGGTGKSDSKSDLTSRSDSLQLVVRWTTGAKRHDFTGINHIIHVYPSK